MSRPVSLFAAALALVASSPRAALAEPIDTQRKAAAQALFDEARALTAEGKYAPACPKLLESVKLDPTPGTKFYLGDCLEHVGKLASAWTYYVDAADSAKTAEREQYARVRAEAMKPRLARLAVKVSDAVRALPGLEVKRDGAALGEGQWETAIPVDPGRHTITAAAKGKEPWELAVDAIEEGKTITVEVPALRDPAPAKVAPAMAVAKPDPVEPPRASGRRVAGLAAGAVGLAGLAVGGIFGGLALSKQGASNQGHCDKGSDTCDPMGLDLRKQAIGAATGSTVGFVIGGLGVAAGAVLVLTAPHGAPAQVAVGPGSIALIGRW